MCDTNYIFPYLKRPRILCGAKLHLGIQPSKFKQFYLKTDEEHILVILETNQEM